MGRIIPKYGGLNWPTSSPELNTSPTTSSRLRSRPLDTRTRTSRQSSSGELFSTEWKNELTDSIVGNRHLHLDHAGGLDLFKGMPDIPIWVHERELKSAFYSVATGADAGVYL